MVFTTYVRVDDYGSIVFYGLYLYFDFNVQNIIFVVHSLDDRQLETYRFYIVNEEATVSSQFIHWHYYCQQMFSQNKKGINCKGELKSCVTWDVTE